MCFLLSDFDLTTGKFVKEEFSLGSTMGQAIVMTDKFMAVGDKKNINLYLRNNQTISKLSSIWPG